MELLSYILGIILGIAFIAIWVIVIVCDKSGGGDGQTS